jgi:glycosyltransferase involved in cell wall biosynthesis
MKILVLSYEYPPIGGGGGIICKNISENLAKLGNIVTVLTTAFHNNKESQISNLESQISNLKLIGLPSRRKNAFQSNPIEMLSWIYTTKKYIRENNGFVNFDVCMAHFILPGGDVALWLKREYGLPYVLISHGHEIPWVHPRQMFFLHLGAYLWLKEVCRHSEVNFVQTSVMKTNIDRFTGKKYRSKNVIIPNGVDSSIFYPDYSKRPEKLRIIFTGRLVIQKDPMTFLKAIKLFSDHSRDFEVHIIGDGNLRNKMERFVAKSRLAENVKFLGKVPEEQMLTEYQSAHLMVAPSLSEGMSIAALEALSCGAYVIATRASGFEDMIQENVNGEFVNFRDSGNLYEKLFAFSGENRKEQPVAKTVLNVRRETFNWEKIALNYLEFLKNVQNNFPMIYQ